MTDQLTIDVEAAAVLAALDRLGAGAAPVVDAVARDTAERIKAEAQARIKRRTGRTAAAITVEPSRFGSGAGYVVLIGPGREHIGYFLEWGTKFMEAAPFFFAPARLEEQPHRQRLAVALQAAIDAEGLGE